MIFDTYRLIWLFPIVFILHDFEELLLFEPWLKKNASFILDRIKNKVSAFLEGQLNTVLKKSTTQFALPISLIFILTCISSLLAAEYGKYSFFLIASSLFFLHGFMHIGQAIFLRRYVPAVITTVFIIIPYGVVLFWSLIVSGIIGIPSLLIIFLVAAVIAIPFILLMHIVGEYLYKRVIDLLVG
jgi:Protein of unknown function with HXXEE motif